MSAQLSVTVVVSREDDRFIAQCLEVDVSSFGATQTEALAMVTEALELWFEDTPVPDHLNPRLVRQMKN
ncbi:MAG: type II toxin-antitoxin system HicB family antitoxin [Pseudonocardiaceae bacterium]